MRAMQLIGAKMALSDNWNRPFRFELLDDIQRRSLADPVLNIAEARRAGEPDRLDELRVQSLRILRAQVFHRVDAEPPDQRNPAIHA